jgi:hypothetical protein
VDPLNNRNNLSLDGGDRTGDGTDNRSAVTAPQHISATETTAVASQ